MKRNLRLKFWLSGSVIASTALFAADVPVWTNAPATTNTISLDALVADVLEHNPELKFYSAEIAAAKGERRTAVTLANPEASATLRVAPASLAFPDAAGIDTLLAAARANNFDVKMRQAELEQQGFKVSLAKNERNPSFSVGPYFSQERAGDRETQVGLGVTIPLSMWNRNKGGIEVAQARQVQAQTSLYVTQREVERKVAEQAIRYATKLNEMSKWRPDSVEQFREAATLADRHYRLGAVPIATYVELQKQYLEAMRALLDTKKEALEAGQQLEVLTGLPLPIEKKDAEKKTP
jgi:outer membrane protein TolC